MTKKLHYNEERKLRGWAPLIPKKPFRATEEQKAEIRAAHRAGTRVGRLVQKYDATYQTIYRILYKELGLNGHKEWSKIRRANDPDRIVLKKWRISTNTVAIVEAEDQDRALQIATARIERMNFGKTVISVEDVYDVREVKEEK